MPDLSHRNRTMSVTPPPPPPLSRRPRAKNPARFLPRLPRASDPARFTNPRLFQRRPLTQARLSPVGIRRTSPATAAVVAGDTRRAVASAAVPAAAAAAAGDNMQELASAVTRPRRRARSANGRPTQAPQHRASPLGRAAAPRLQPSRQRARSATREEVLQASMTSLRECFQVLENVKHLLTADAPATPVAPAAPMPRMAPTAPPAAPLYAPPYRVSSPVRDPQSTLADLLKGDTQSRKRLVE